MSRAVVLCRRALAGRPVASSGALRNVAQPRHMSADAHDDHHGPVTYDPPFQRIAALSKPIHEQDELMWNDGVAPETCIDFDAPSVGTGEAVMWMLGGFGFFYSIWVYSKWTRHAYNRPSASRELPEGVLERALGDHGFIPKKNYAK